MRASSPSGASACRRAGSRSTSPPSAGSATAIVLALQVERLGGASLALALRCRGRDDGVQRMAMRQVLVTTSLDSHRAVELPADLRSAIERWHGSAAA